MVNSGDAAYLSDYIRFFLIRVAHKTLLNHRRLGRAAM